MSDEYLPLDEANKKFEERYGHLVHKMSLSEALELVVRLGTHEEAIGEEYIRKAMQKHEGKLK